MIPIARRKKDTHKPNEFKYSKWVHRFLMAHQHN